MNCVVCGNQFKKIEKGHNRIYCSVKCRTKGKWQKQKERKMGFKQLPPPNVTNVDGVKMIDFDAEVKRGSIVLCCQNEVPVIVPERRW